MLITRKNYGALTIGTRVKFKTTGTNSPEATYVGTVVGNYTNHIVVNAAPIPSTMKEKPIFGNPRPYNISISKNSIDSEGTQILILEEDYDKETEERAG